MHQPGPAQTTEDQHLAQDGVHETDDDGQDRCGSQVEVQASQLRETAGGSKLRIGIPVEAVQ